MIPEVPNWHFLCLQKIKKVFHQKLVTHGLLICSSFNVWMKIISSGTWSGNGSESEWLKGIPDLFLKSGSQRKIFLFFRWAGRSLIRSTRQELEEAKSHRWYKIPKTASLSSVCAFVYCWRTFARVSKHLKVRFEGTFPSISDWLSDQSLCGSLGNVNSAFLDA